MRKLLTAFIALLVGANVVMANDYFNASGVPSTGAALNSATMRGEFSSIGAGFDKLPALTGNGSKMIAVNSGGTALEAVSTVRGTTGTFSSLTSGQLPLVSTAGLLISTSSFTWSEASTNPTFFIDASSLGGDAQIKLKDGTAANTFSLGVDASDSGSFVISNGAALGTNNIARANTTGFTGLKFSPTATVSADANTLDDYERGTWTPVLTFETAGNLSVTYATQVGTYTKKGREVTLTGNIVTSAFTHTTASGVLNVTGAPFTSANTSGLNHYGALSWGGITKANYTQVSARLTANVTTLDFIASGSGQAVSQISSADVPSGGTVTIRFTIVYHI